MFCNLLYNEYLYVPFIWSLLYILDVQIGYKLLDDLGNLLRTPKENVVATNQPHSIQVSFLPHRFKFIIFLLVHRGAQRQNLQNFL